MKIFGSFFRIIPGLIVLYISFKKEEFSYVCSLLPENSYFDPLCSFYVLF